MKSAKISGDIGDVIYSLPTIKALGVEIVYLNYNNKYKPLKWQTKFSEASAVALKPLLEVQPYIKRVAFYDGQKIDYDLDAFRIVQKDLTYQNLAHAIANTFSVDISTTDSQWLFANPVKMDRPILFNKTDRYLNPYVDWKYSYEHFFPYAAFVGIESEYEKFCKEMDIDIPYYPTKNFLELAQLIYGCDLFIGNQSSPYAIAEGLKKDTIQIVCRYAPNCIFKRDNAKYDGITIYQPKPNFIQV